MGEGTANGRPRVAVVSLHTSPLDQPGTGDSGGMNVYIRAAADRLAARGLDVDVFTRCRGEDLREVEDLSTGPRIVRVKAGPCAPVPKEELPRWMEYPRSPPQRRALIQHVAGHVDHIHVRFACQAHERRCESRDR